MSIKLYTDHNVPQAVVDGCRQNGIDVITAFEDAAHRHPDRWLLDRATRLNRALVTQDQDFLAEAARRQKTGIRFNGVIFAHSFSLTIGEFIFQLRFICETCNPSELIDVVMHLPI